MVESNDVYRCKGKRHTLRKISSEIRPVCDYDICAVDVFLMFPGLIDLIWTLRRFRRKNFGKAYSGECDFRKNAYLRSMDLEFWFGLAGIALSRILAPNSFTM